MKGSHTKKSNSHQHDQMTQDGIALKASQVLKKQNIKASQSCPIYERKVDTRIFYSASSSPDNRTIISGCGDGVVACI